MTTVAGPNAGRRGHHVAALIAALVVVAAVLVPTGADAGGKPNGNRLFAYPGHAVGWQRGEGLPDAVGNAAQALRLAKFDPTVPEWPGTPVSGANLLISSDITVDHLSVWVRRDGECGSAPYFRLATSPTTVVLRCANGLVTGQRTEASGTWERRTFRLPVALRGELRLQFTLPEGRTGQTYVDDIAFGTGDDLEVITKP